MVSNAKNNGFSETVLVCHRWEVLLRTMASVKQFWFATVENYLLELVNVSLMKSLLHQVNSSSLVDTLYRNSISIVQCCVRKIQTHLVVSCICFSKCNLLLALARPRMIQHLSSFSYTFCTFRLKYTHDTELIALANGFIAQWISYIWRHTKPTSVRNKPEYLRTATGQVSGCMVHCYNILAYSYRKFLEDPWVYF